jgi:uncharacterized protein YoxC
VIHLRSESGEKSDFGPSELKPDTPGEEQTEKVLMREIKELPVLTVEKIDETVHEIKKINDTLTGLQASLSRLADGMRGIEQVRKEQETSNSVLREIAGLLEDLKAKKRRLKFW